MTAFDGADTGPEPLALEACTVNVYWVPLVEPVTVTLVAGAEPDTVVAGRASPATYGVTV